jgi:site-specific recombinase XerD
LPGQATFRNTLAYYGTTANAFASFLEQQKLESLETLTVHHLRAYMRELETKGLGPGGLHAHVRALKAIFNWAQHEELLMLNPSKKLERPSLPKLHLPTLTPETVSSLLVAAKHGKQPLRDTALVYTLFDT